MGRTRAYQLGTHESGEFAELQEGLEPAEPRQQEEHHNRHPERHGHAAEEHGELGHEAEDPRQAGDAGEAENPEDSRQLENAARYSVRPAFIIAAIFVCSKLGATKARGQP